MVHIEPAPGFLPDDLLVKLASVERASEHPLAMAVVAAAQERHLPLVEVTDFDSPVGKGVLGKVGNVALVSGAAKFLAEHGVDVTPLQAAAELQRTQAATVIFVALDGRLAGFVAIADPIKATTPAALRSLREAGVRIVMLTGDQKAVAHAIAEEAGVDEVLAELLPEGKVAAIRELKKQGRVLMVGDGVNDAPALACADIGVAMGAAGTDIAMETADVVLMGDKLENISIPLAIARHARRVLWQNLVFASAVIVLLLIAAFGIHLPLPMGVVGHEGSTVLVCLNGLRLLIYMPKV